MSNETGDRFSDVNRQPDGDHRLRVARVIGDAAPAKPPIAICENHEARYGDCIASSDPYEVTASVRKKESPMISGRSTAIEGRANRNPFSIGDMYSNRCTKLR